MANRFARTAIFASLSLLALAVPPPVHPQEVDWERGALGAVRNVLDNHYTRRMTSDVSSVACLAQRGDTCFGGDHWDRACMRVVPCRTPAAMRQFISELQRLGTSRPRDPLAVAHSVYGLVRLGQMGPAVMIAEQCRAADWWCDLVLGMAHHRSGGSALADSHYRSALLRGDPELTCLLTDITNLVEGRDAASYRRLPCPSQARSAFEDRFWWLSDPFLTRPGNDRWTEHVTRRIELVLDGQLGARGGDNRRSVDAVTRRGHPDSWMQRMRQIDFWKSVAAARYQFTPASLAGDGVQALRYELEAGRWDEGYTPLEYGPVFEVNGQVARFLEGDSLFLAAAADLDGAPFDPRDIRFAATEGATGYRASRGGTPGSQSPTFTLAVPQTAMLVAIEAFGERGDAARMRQGVLPLAANAVAVSDVLVLDPRLAELPANREEAVGSMHPQTWIGNANELVVYWEIYGLRTDETVEITVALQSGGAGLVTRIMRTLGGQTTAPATTVSWTEPVSGPVHAMAMTVDVDRLEQGDYDLNIDIRGPDGSTASTVRRVRLGRR